MAEFGICNFSEVSPSVFTPSTGKKSQQTTPTPPKSAKRRKAREASETHSETKEEFVETPTDAKTANDPGINNENDDLTENEVKVENNGEETETKPKFICINCQEGFETNMSLSFHQTYCVPDDFFDEFPSEIVENGDHGVRNGNKNSPKVSAKHEPDYREHPSDFKTSDLCMKEKYSFNCQKYSESIEMNTASSSNNTSGTTLELGQQDNLESKMNQDADLDSMTDSHSSSSTMIDSNDAKNATKTDILKINSEGASQQTINTEHIADINEHIAANNNSIGHTECTQKNYEKKNQKVREKNNPNKKSEIKTPAFKGNLLNINAFANELCNCFECKLAT